MRRGDPDRVFRVSVLVQLAGAVSLVTVPLVIGLLMLAIVGVSVVLAIVVGLAFVVGLQIAIAKRWTSVRKMPASPNEALELHAAVERLCTVANLRKPKLFIEDRPHANSWVTGLRSRSAKLHVTALLLEVLDAHQQEAVIAHELAHIGQRDCALMTLVEGAVASMLDSVLLYFHGVKTGPKTARELVRAVNQGDPDSPATPIMLELLVVYALWMLFLLPLILMFAFVGGACRLVTATFSRVREFEADAGAARLTGNPAGLASALLTLDSQVAGIPVIDMRRDASLDAFHILPVSRERWPVRTHPRTEARVARLRRMEERLSRSVAR